MKILTAKQSREADAYTIAHEPISSLELMERAAAKCFEWLIKQYSLEKEFAVFCGVGNNGGDGLVVARLLKQAGYKVAVWVVEFSKKHSPDFQVNLKRLKKEKVDLHTLTTSNYKFQIPTDAVVVDAIFGSGLTRTVEGFVADIIHRTSDHEVVAIDLPSGLFAEDNSTNIKNNIIQAKYTLTFQQPKLAMLFPENNNYVGEWVVLPIGLNQEFIDQQSTPYRLITKEDIEKLLQTRSKFSHKGNYGHALIIAGSKGKIGAAVLASRACLRTGVGLLTTHVPTIGYAVLQTVVPEAMCSTSDHTDYIADLPDLSPFTVVGVGPGIGIDKQTANTLKLLIQNAKTPLVMDADALNILSENKTWLAFLPSQSILTPHPKEFERLVGKWSGDEERLEKQIAFSIKNKVIVVLKGAHTSVSTPAGEVYFNSTGNAGMATGGSGDVLTGVITSFLAQGYTPLESAVAGVYIHGLAGDVAKENYTEQGMIASDITEALPRAFGWINQQV